MNPVAAAHLHLVLCHIPSVVLLVGLAWLAWGLWRLNDAVQKAALGTLAAAAFTVVPLYMTGDPTVRVVKGLPAVSDAILERHEAASGAALAGGIVLGAAAGVALFVYRTRPLSRKVGAALLAGAVAAAGLEVWTAGLGGQVRHSEIRPYEAPPE